MSITNILNRTLKTSLPTHFEGEVNTKASIHLYQETSPVTAHCSNTSQATDECLEATHKHIGTHTLEHTCWNTRWNTHTQVSGTSNGIFVFYQRGVTGGLTLYGRHHDS